MAAHLLRSFRSLFTIKRNRLRIGFLIMSMAALPVAEMAVIRLFSTLIIEGPALIQSDSEAALISVAMFFGAFGITRGLQHYTRFERVRTFRIAFEAGGRKSSPSQESWEWALAFELSGILTSLIQVVTFGMLFIVLDFPVGLVNIAVCLSVLLLVSRIYSRQLGRQKEYVAMGSKPGTVTIAERVGGRIRDGESGSLIASIGMVLVLVVVLLRTLDESIVSADAIVLFLGLRLLYGQLGSLSGASMRFARASARRGKIE